MPSLGLIASQGVRERQLGKFLERHSDTLKSYFLVVTWGTYSIAILDEEASGGLSSEKPLEAYSLMLKDGRIPWRPRYDWMDAGWVLRPGKWGGIIEMAEHLEVSAGDDRLTDLIFFASPGDVEESYPDDRALVRSILRNDVNYLSTIRTAELWASFECGARPPKPAAGVAPTKPEDEVLAIIAHDGKKLELCRWVVQHRHVIGRFRNIITTGTTGALVKDFLAAANFETTKIDLIKQRDHGPSGGDVQIAGEILRGQCHHVVFFVDPMTSHPHEADIQALLRICALPDVHVNLRLNRNSATSWIRSIESPEARIPVAAPPRRNRRSAAV